MSLYSILPGNPLSKIAFVLLYYVYVLVMWTWRKRETPLGRAAFIPVTVVGAVLDIFVNIVFASIMFRDRPRELLLTARLIRYRKTEETSWRGITAAKICDEYLDKHDPSGDHC